MKQTMEIIFEDQVTGLMKEFLGLVKHFPNIALEISDGAFLSPDFFKNIISLESMTTEAGEVMVLFKPTDSFLNMLSTLRARAVN